MNSRFILAALLFAIALPSRAANPSGGTFTLNKELVPPFNVVLATFNDWTGDNLPLKYQLRVNGALLDTPSTNKAIYFQPPIDDGSYQIVGIVSDAQGNITEVSRTVAVDGTPPVITRPAFIEVVSNETPGAVVNFEVTAVDNTDPAPFLFVSPPSGTFFPPGITYVGILARDWLGNETQDTIIVSVRAMGVKVVGSAGKLIGDDLEDSPGGRIQSFGVPTLTNLRRIVVTGRVKDGAGRTVSGVLLGKPVSTRHEWIMPLRVGGPADDVTPGLVWKAFPKEPFASVADDFDSTVVSNRRNAPVEMGIFGRVAGPGVTSANDDVLAYFAKRPETPGHQLTVIAREGGDAVGVTGGKFKTFIAGGIATRLNFDAAAPSRAIAFTAMLQTGPQGSAGPGGVNNTNDMGLWVWEDGALSLSLREGDQIDGRTVRSFVTLRGPVGHGQAYTSDYQGYHSVASVAGFTTTVLITFTDGKRRLVVAGSLGTRKLLDENVDGYWVDAGWVYPIGGLQNWGRFQAWSRNRYGSVLLQTTMRNRPSATNTIVLAETGDADSQVIAYKGDILPDGSVLTSLKSPVLNSQFNVAFAGTTNTRVSGGWWGWEYENGNVKHAEFFRAGAPAPGTAGAVWRALKTFALPDEVGPLFTASLRAGLGAPRGVTTTTDLGLWGLDSLGVTRLMIREGQTIEGKTVRSFKALTNVSGSPGQTRTFNNRGTGSGIDEQRKVIVWVQATDLTQHLIEFTIP